MEADDDEGYYKNELAKEERAKYYRAKREAQLLEETNNSKLVLFPSLSGEKLEWYKMGGVLGSPPKTSRKFLETSRKLRISLLTGPCHYRIIVARASPRNSLWLDVVTVRLLRRQ